MSENVPALLDRPFGGTDNNGPVDVLKGTDTNVYKMYLAADRNLVYKIYEAGVGTGGIAGGKINGALLGLTCGAIEQDAMTKITNDLKKEIGGDFIINIVGFSRGGPEALDFANKVETQIQQGGKYFTGARIGFLGLFDPVDAIDGLRNDAGNLNITVPRGISHVAEAIALSENRLQFNKINLMGSPNTTVIGFLGAHSDIGGGYGNDPLSNTTLHWMMSQATAAGLAFTNMYPGLVNGYAPAQVHDSYAINLGGPPLAPIQRNLPGTLLVDTPGGYIRYNAIPFASSYWDPCFANDLSIYSSLTQTFRIIA